MNRKLFSNTILYTIGEVVPRIIAFLMMPIFTRYLVPADYGILSYTNSVIAFVYAFCTLSLNTYVLRFYFDCKNEDEKKKLLGNIFVFIAFVNSVVLVLLNFAMPIVIEKAHIAVPWKPYFRLAIFNNFLESFSIIPLVYFRVKQNAKAFVSVSVGRCIAQYIATFIFLVPLRMGVMAQYYGRLFTLFPFFFLYVGIICINGRINFNWNQIKDGLKYSLPLLPGSISYLALTGFDRIVLERYVSLEVLGIYNIAYTIAFALNMIIQSFYRALEPDIFQKYNSEAIEGIFVPYMRKMNNVYNFALYAMALFLSLFAKEALMIVASEKYYSAVMYVPSVLVGVIFAGRKLMIDCALAAEKRSIVSGIGTMIGAGISVIINLILIPRLGVIAAPIALSLSYLAMNIFLKICNKIKFYNNVQDIFAMGIFMFCSIIPMMKFDFSEFKMIGIKMIVYTIAIFLFLVNFHMLDYIKLLKSSKNN